MNTIGLNNYPYCKVRDCKFITLVSLRDIVRLLNKFLKDARIEEVTLKQRYKQLQLIKGV